MPVSSVPLSETHIAGRPREAIRLSSSRTTASLAVRYRHQNQTFTREVVDDREDTEPPAIRKSIR